MPRKDSRKDSKNSKRNNHRQEAPAEEWKPKTELGRKVKEREITEIDEILDNGLSVLEPQIVDSLMELDQDLLLIGQSKGKFGGGARRVFRQTQKKTREGNKPKFSTVAVVGDKNGHVGIGFGKAKETVPAREKAIRKAKLNLFKIVRGSGSWEDASTEANSIPYKVTGKCGSVEVTLLPAPKGKGLCCEKEMAKILALAGIKDVWSQTKGQTKNKLNLIYAVEDALKQLIKTKTKPKHVESHNIVIGSIKKEKAQTE
jgi:small subunit ribosomal protein S5